MALDLKFNNLSSYTPSSFQSGTTNAGPGLAGMGAANSGGLRNSSLASPAANLERNNLSLDNYRYPLDLGTNYPHILRIFIYKQEQSKFKFSTIPGNQFRFDQQAGQDKTYNVSAGIAAGAIGTARTAKAGLEAMTGQDQSSGLSKTGTAAVEGTASTALAKNLDTSRKAKIPVAYISLFMPDSIVYDDKHDFDEISVTEALGNAGLLSQGTAAATGGAQGTGKLAAMEGATKLAGTDIVGKGILDVNQLSLGYTLNPQMEILYRRSKQRQFQFQFRFAPRNQQEMQSLEDIIRTLRFHAAPEYATGTESRYFVPPSEFEVDFFIKDKRNTHIPRIAQSVLTNVDVNYAPQGHYSTFHDGAPIEVQMQLTFLETIVLTKDDIMLGY